MMSLGRTFRRSVLRFFSQYLLILLLLTFFAMPPDQLRAEEEFSSHFSGGEQSLLIKLKQAPDPGPLGPPLHSLLSLHYEVIRMSRLLSPLPEGARVAAKSQLRRSAGLDRWILVDYATDASLEDIVSDLQGLDQIERVEADLERSGLGCGKELPPNDPLYSSQWHLMPVAEGGVGALGAWGLFSGTDQSTVAVLDTGVDANHPDLTGRVLPGHDFVNDDTDAQDDQGHGTFVAGVIGASGHNGTDIAGLHWRARILPIKILSSTGAGVVSDSVQGIVLAADRGASIINMSYGGAHSLAEEDAIAYATDLGCLAVGAAGNHGVEGILYPAALTTVIAVGATDRNGNRARSLGTGASNFGSELELMAPGEGILGLKVGGGTVYYSGTSAAAPVVAGIAALLREVTPGLSPSGVRAVLRGTAADQLGLSQEDLAGFDVHHGFGLIQAEAALRSVLSLDLSIRGDLKPSGQGEVLVSGVPGACFALVRDTHPGSLELRGETLGIEGPTSPGFRVLHRLSSDPLASSGPLVVPFEVPANAQPGDRVLLQAGMSLPDGTIVLSGVIHFAVDG